MKLNNFNKKYSTLIVVAICGLLFNSCKKYLDVQPISGFTPNLVFDNVPDAEKAVIGVYQELAGDYGYGLHLSLYYPYDNDEMMGPGGSSGSGDLGKKDITHYKVNSNTVTAVLANPFNQLYEGIERANNCIKYIPLMDAYNNGSASDKAELRWLYGQSLTLRAQYYFDLVKIWGDVPVQYVPSADIPDLFLPKTNRDSIYDHILSDLKVAENIVPWWYQLSVQDERITQSAVRGLRARVALFRGGFSLRQDGTMQRGSNWQAYYQIAKDECDTIITLGQHGLNSNFQSVFQNGLCIGAIDNKEVLFQVGMSGGAIYSDSKIGIYDGPKSTVSGSGGILVLPTYFYLFDSTDTRRDVTCAPFTLDANGVQTPSKISAIYDGKFRRNWVPGGSASVGQYLGQNWPLIRYSDILLMYAEADNELNNQPSATAISRFEQVRLRAFNNDATKIGVTPTTHDGFFNAIMKERSLEFGGEGLRKYDLVRWDSLASKIAQTQTTLTNMFNVTQSNGLTPADYTYNGYVVAQLPTSVYWKRDGTATGYNWLTSFYAKQANPGGGAFSSSWLGSSIQSTFTIVYAYAFVANKSELYPFHQSVISANPNILQNPNY